MIYIKVLSGIFCSYYAKIVDRVKRHSTLQDPKGRQNAKNRQQNVILTFCVVT